MNSCVITSKPAYSSPSTLLVSRIWLEKFQARKLYSLKGRRVSDYLHFLLSDPLLERKLKLLYPAKWKKQYQREGQDLVRLDFVPCEEDWARLSIISNGRGFSRCFIFVFLMLIDLGILKLKNLGTPKNNYYFQPDSCSVKILESQYVLKRCMHYPPELRNSKNDKS